ncbi:P-loop containing nucleoside triphosphate hydrolase protein [Coprinopsis sp. MPI-PUGE-AT-0042]|nr:P-loop containing nucleoside triphosphate hydrolase protein [Coprinopsis sp. MPI-PUGE-AT-0042]
MQESTCQKAGLFCVTSRGLELRGFIEGAVEERMGFKPCKFQLDAIEAQLLGKDVVVHAGTGMGKTLIAAAPHYHPSAAGKLTIMVSPLVTLQNEQVVTFAGMGVKAVAVNSNHEFCLKSKLILITHQALKGGVYQILLISPELLLSRRFIDEMLCDRAFTSCVLAVVVDEAHVVSHWGAGFRKKYGELRMIRAFLRRRTPMVTMSATLAGRVRRDILRKLEYAKDGWVFVNIGNVGPNVALAVRAIEHAMNTYVDLDFIIPRSIEQASDIPATLLYADNVPHITDIIDHLETLLPQHLQYTGLIRPFSTAFSHDYRSAAMDHFKRGRVRVLVCTDAAGMGCNLPAVHLVVQWKLPQSLSTFVQRARRAARSASRTGLAVLLKPKAKGKGKEKSTPSDKAAEEATKRTKKDSQACAIVNGVKRGSHSGKKDEIVGERCEKVPKADADDEGLVVFIQTTLCRHLVITKVYENVHSEKPAVCCDLCHPSLLDRMRPGKAPKSTQQAAVKKTSPVEAVKTVLHSWQASVHSRDFPDAMFSPSGLMSDALVAKLATSGRVTSLEGLTQVVGPWKLLDKYGKDVVKNIFLALAAPDGAKKRKERDDEEDIGCQAQRIDRHKASTLPSAVTASLMASMSNTTNPPLPRSSSLPLGSLPPPSTPLHPPPTRRPLPSVST